MKILSHKLLILIALLLAVSACRDEEFFPVMETISSDSGNNSTRAELTNPGALQQEGDYWVAKGQVPLVGVGRVADDISGSLVSLLDVSSNKLDYMFDTDLTNSAKLKSGIVGAEVAANQVISVRDLYHVYKGGQKVGFVIKAADSGILTADVLGTMWIETSLNNKRQETISATDNSGVLSLNLLSPKNSSMQTVSVKTTLPFDEIKLGIGGVDVSLLSGLEIYYAFVGENEAIPITTSNFPSATVEAGGMWAPLIFTPADLDKLLDANALDKGPIFAVAAVNPSVEVDLTKCTTQIPEGSEIGFKTNSGGVLGIDAFKTTVIDYTIGDSKYTETLDGSVVGISLIGGGNSLLGTIPAQNGSQLKGNVTKLGIEFRGLNLDLLEATTICYPYYRTPVEIDPSTYFVVANDTVTSSSYVLPSIRKDGSGSVEYTFKGGPAQAEVKVVDGKNILAGMTVAGDYYMQAVYTSANGKQIAYNFIVTRLTKDIPTCHTPLVTSTYPGAKVINTSEFTGCLLCLAENELDENHLAGNIVNPNTNDYAGYIGGVTLAHNTGIVAVDAGQSVSGSQKMRVGFVLQTAKEFLGLGALNFFRIRVLDAEGKEIADQVAAQNNTVGLGLLDGNGNKIRYSIEVDGPFRYVELYSSGVADVSLSSLRVYYAFWEDMSNNACAESLAEGIQPDEACTTLLSGVNKHADIYYEGTISTGLANVDASFSSLAYAIDNSRNTAALIPIINVAGGTTLGIKFDQLSGGQQVGVMLRDPNGVLKLDALRTSVTVRAYLGSRLVSSTDDNDASFGLVDLNVIGYGNRYYIEITPTADFDRVVINLGQGLASVLTMMQVYGVYYRPDADGDGIPDCSENPDETEPAGVIMTLEAEDICVGDAVGIKAETGLGTPIQEVYYLQCVASGKKEVIPVSIVNGNLMAADSARPLTLYNGGIYALRLFDTKEHANGDGTDGLISVATLVLTVHPEETIWTGARSSDWNTWDNWTNGTPWDCTNVIIPGNVTRFPTLTQSSYQSGMNRCNYIHIKDGGQLVNSFYLNSYNKAWVNLNLTGGRYYMLSAPLKDMVSGDMFISPGETPDSFTQLTEQTYKEVRTNPYIYQRLWSTDAPVKNPAGYQASGTVSPDETNWTPPYNALTQKYEAGQGFSLMAGKTTGTTYEFVFPKMHQTYHYYSLSGSPTGMTESVHSDRSVSGRFIYEGAWKNNALTVTLTNQKEGLAFLAGNPFMAHIDLKTFMAYNNIKEVKVYDGTVNNSLILIDGELVSSTGSALNYVMPMEAFFVMNATAATSRKVTFTPSMLSAGASRTRALSRAALASAGVGNGMLRISASAEGSVSSCLLRVSDKAGAAVRQGEDTRLLMDSETRPKAVVYTVADQTALDIQQIPSSVGRIPLGFYLAREGMNVTLSFDYAGSAWSGCVIVNSRTGTRTAISAGKVTLNNVTSGSGVYYLERK